MCSKDEIITCSFSFHLRTGNGLPVNKVKDPTEEFLDGRHRSLESAWLVHAMAIQIGKECASRRIPFLLDGNEQNTREGESNAARDRDYITGF